MHNLKNIILSLFLVLSFGGPAFSNEDLNSDIDSLEEENVNIEVYVDEQGNASHTPPPTQEKIDVNKELSKVGMKKGDLKALMESLRKADPEGFAKMERGELSPEESNQMMERAMKKLPPKAILKMMGGTSKMLTNQLGAVSRGLNAMSFEQALGSIKAKVDESKAAPFFKMVPKSHELLTHFLRDEDASSKFFGIIKDRKRLLTFAGINIFLIFVGWRIKVRRRKMNYSASESFSKGLRHFIIFNTIKIGVIWYFFSLELRPLWGVIQRTYS